MTLNAKLFSRFGAANVATSGRLLVTGHIANMFALAANANWDSAEYKAVSDSAFCDAMRADIRAVKDCKATASGHVKFAVANTKGAFEFFAGIISRRESFASEQDMVKAAYIQADAAGATTGASLSRLLKGKPAHEMEVIKTPETVEEKRERESALLDSAKIAAPVSLADMFSDVIKLVTVETPPPSPLMGRYVNPRHALGGWIEDCEDVAELRALAAKVSARINALFAKMDSALLAKYEEKQAVNG
jgi:hypothetical protein